MLTQFVATLLAIVLGALSGVADLHSREVQGPVLLLLTTAALLGALFPEGAWRRALMLGLSIPLAHAIARLTGAVLPYQVNAFGGTFLALVPAFVGSYVGVGLRRLRDGQQEKHPRS